MSSIHHTSSSYIVLIPAYNEASSILRALDAIHEADKYTEKTLAKIIICVNGCTDGTTDLARGWKKAPVTILETPAGYARAVNRLIAHARRYYPDHIVVKTDADSQIEKHALSRLFSQFEKHDELVVAGGHPIPTRPTTRSPYRQLLSRILSIRSLYPLSERAIANVERFHQYADDDPQPNIGAGEKRTKIYFHGRLWSVRAASFLRTLDADAIGDDAFLSDWTLYTYGEKSIRVMYDANVIFIPNYSLRRHWKVYRRVTEDCQRVGSIPELTQLQELCALELDWGYILTSVKKRHVPLFVAYALIKWFENFSYAHIKYKDTYWQYREKEA
jgi:glycosyltransferase involved in cell wall biosynthesis